MCVDMRVWMLKMLSLYSQLVTNHIVVLVCLDTILKNQIYMLCIT